MIRWAFRDYVHSNGNNPIRKWYTKELSGQEQADLDTLLTALERAQSWGCPITVRSRGPKRDSERSVGKETKRGHCD
jgi:hypothetical protein